MKARYTLSRPARRDLQKIADYLTGQAGYDTALRIVMEIVEAIILMATQPRGAVLAEEFGEGVGRFPVRDYIVYYLLGRSSSIQVLHVFHGVQDQKKAWKKR